MKLTSKGAWWKLLLVATIVASVALAVWWKTTSAPARPKIVVILPSPSNPFWIEVKRGAEDAKAAVGSAYDVIVQSSLDMNTASQVDLLNNFLARKAVDALVLGPTSDVETVPTVAKYAAVGIPIVLIDTELNPKEMAMNQVKVAAFIGSDNVDGGRKAAKTMADALKGKSRKVLLIEGSRVHQSAIDRAEGFTEVATKEGLQVTSVNGEWKRDRAQELVSAQFSRGRVDGIFASNDDMALGAVAGLKASGISSKDWPIVIGFDATRDGLAAVVAGDMFATIQQDAHLLGERGVQAAVKALKHDPSLLSKDFQKVIVRTR